MALLTLRFQIENQIVHELIFTKEDLSANNIQKVKDLKLALQKKLTIPLETISIYDSDNYSRLVYARDVAVKDLRDDATVPIEKKTIWYWSYIAEEPEEYKTKRDRCLAIINTAIEQVTTDMNLAFYGIYRKVVIPEDNMDERYWININFVPLDAYVNKININDPNPVATYNKEHPQLYEIEKRLKNRIELLSKDMGLAVTNIQYLFNNYKILESNGDFKNLQGPISEASLAISLVKKAEAYINVGLLNHIQSQPRDASPISLLPSSQPRGPYGAIYATSISGSSVSTSVSSGVSSSAVVSSSSIPSEKLERESHLLENTVAVAEKDAVQTITSKALDYSFTSNLYDIQKVSGMFVNLKKERCELLRYLHQLETRRKLFILRDYLFQLRAIVPKFEEYKINHWTDVQSYVPLKRRKIQIVSQGAVPVCCGEGGLIVEAGSFFNITRIIPPETSAPSALVTFKEEIVGIMMLSNVNAEDAKKETEPWTCGENTEMFQKVEKSEIIWSILADDKKTGIAYLNFKSKERSGIYVIHDNWMRRQSSALAEKDRDRFKGYCMSVFNQWKVSNKISERTRIYAWTSATFSN